MHLISFNHGQFLCLTLKFTLNKAAFFSEKNGDKLTCLCRWTQHKHGLLFVVIGVSDTGGPHVLDGGDRDDDDVVGDGY